MVHKLPFGIKVKRRGLKRSVFRDIYQLVLRISWFEFLASAFIMYMVVNAFFASLYYLGGDTIENAQTHSFWEAFMFSFQTSTTIGYGYYLPANGYAHAVTVVDTMSGIFFVALITGLAIAKFSKPTANVIFSKNLVINTYDGLPTLMFRVGNARASHIVDASLRMTLLKNHVSSEGYQMRRLFDLPVVRDNTPMFFLSWTVMHAIDKDSPLYGQTLEDFKKDQVSIIVSLTGIDDWSAQQVHANYFYRHDDICMGQKFVDIISTTEDGILEMDYSKFQDLEEKPL